MKLGTHLAGADRIGPQATGAAGPGGAGAEPRAVRLGRRGWDEGKGYISN